MSQTPSNPAMTDAGALFRMGRLTDAIAAANGAVRAKPSDPTRRLLLAELLLFSGDLERADVILDACGDLDPSLAVMAAEFRQLVRAETARRQLFSDGRLPEFLGGIEFGQQSALRALVALREDNAAAAGQLAAEAEATRLHPAGETGGRAFDDLRDADDLLAGAFEVLTTTGKYFWVPIERVARLEFHPPRRPRDLFWRRASMQVTDGPDGEIYMPAIYVTAPFDPAPTDTQRLGRETDWVQVGESGPVRGVGAKTFLVGDDPATLMELTTLTFKVAP
jgi:type VI secretion system protein ImpE